MANIYGFFSLIAFKIIKYNNKLIQKRIYKKNPFFNWFIVDVDPDMKIISMKMVNDHKIKPN